MAKQEMIRGVTAKQYAKYMHDIERSTSGRGEKCTERSLVRSGKLKKSTRGIRPTQRNSAKIFNNRNKTRGKGKPGQCRVPTCEKSSSRRGLCNTHRIEARRMIGAKKTTEQNLLNRGLLLPKAGSSSNRKAGKPRAKSKPKGKKRTNKKLKLPLRGKKVRFPKKLLNAKTCLYKGCKTTRRGGSRGLCVKHYSQYKRKRAKLSDRKKKALDKDLIKRKMLLPPKPKPKSSKKIKRRRKKKLPESSAFEIGSTMRGSIHRY